MALIDCASWKPKSNEFVFAYRFPQTNLSTYTQLIVYESQEALLFSKGQLMGKFGPGKHTLDTAQEIVTVEIAPKLVVGTKEK